MEHLTLQARLVCGKNLSCGNLSIGMRVSLSDDTERQGRDDPAQKGFSSIEEPDWNRARHDHGSKRTSGIADAATDRTTKKDTSSQREPNCDGRGPRRHSRISSCRYNGEDEDKGNQRFDEQDL